MSITTQEIKDIVGELFKQLDKDNSGVLERAEVHQVAEGIHAKVGEGKEFNEEMFAEAFTRLDKNGDGKISLEELTNMFLAGAAKRGLLSDAAQ
jgi:calmodulin